MGGKSSGGNNGTTTVSTTQPPASVLAAYNDVQQRAQQVANAPLQQYQGPIVAGFNPTQTAAMNTISGNVGTAQPYINAAAQEFGQATTPLWGGVQQFSPSAINQYESPYTQQVVQATQNQFNNQNAQQQQALKGQAIQAGAWGGDRADVAAANLAGQQQLAQAPIIAGLQNQGYTQALGEFNQQQQQQLGANQANAWLNSQAAFGLGQLGQEAQNSLAAGAQQQLGIGGLQQQLQQEQLNVPYEQFLQQQAYPFQTTNFLAGVTEGTGAGQGGTSTTTTPGPSSASQLTGLGIAGLGAYGQATSGQGGKGKSTGGAVRKRAAGGGVPLTGAATGLPDVPDVSINYIPATGSGGGGHGSTLPAPPTEAASKAADAQAKQSASKSSGVGNMLGKAAGNSGYKGSGAVSNAAAADSAVGVNAADSQVAGLTGANFGADAFASSGASGASAIGDLGSLADVASFLKRGGVARRAGGGGVAHSNTWLGDIGGLAGSVGGGIYGGPGGAYLGKGVGRDALQGFGDLFAGNWSGLGADANPINMLPASKGGGGNAPGIGKASGGAVAKRASGGSFTAPNGVNIPLLGGASGSIPQIPTNSMAGLGSLGLPSIAANLTQDFSAPHPAVAPPPAVVNPAASTGVVPTSAAPQDAQTEMDQWMLDRSGNMGNKRGGVIARHADGNEVEPDTSTSDIVDPSKTISRDSAAGKLLNSSPDAMTMGNVHFGPEFTMPARSAPASAAATGVAPSSAASNPAPSTGVVPAAQPASSGVAPTSTSPTLDTKALHETMTNPHVDPWMSVIQAGLSIAGGQSPHALENIARGAQAGLTNYTQQKQTAVANAEKEFDAEAKAKQLADTAENWRSGREQQKAELAERVANDQANHAQSAATLAQQAKQQERQFGLQQQEFGLRQKEYEDNQYNYVPTVQTDPDDPTKTPVPGVLRMPKHGDAPPTFIPTNTNPNKPSAAAGGQGSRAEVYFNRVMAAGNEAAAAASNIMELPTSSSTGIFGGRSQGPGLMGAAKESLTNSLTSQEVQDYNTMIPGVARNLAAIEASGLAPAGSLTHSMDNLQLKEGDSEMTKLRKMAEMRQIVEKGLEPNLSNPRIPPEQKAAVQKIIQSMQTAIPFTHHDITELQKSDTSGQTMSDLVKAKGLGQSGGAPATIAPPMDAVSHLKANPDLRSAFDMKYGSGAAAKALGE